MSEFVKGAVKYVSKTPLGSPRILLGIGPFIYRLYTILTGNHMGDYSDSEAIKAASISIPTSGAPPRTIVGVYTSRIIVLGYGLPPLEPKDFQNFPSKFKRLEFNCGEADPKTCETEHSNKICNYLVNELSRLEGHEEGGRGGVVDWLREFVRGGDNGDCRFDEYNPPCRFIRTFAEEYVHSMIFRGTSMATLIDQLYWRLRLNTLYITETLYRTLNMPRSASGTPIPVDEVVEYVHDNEPRLKGLPKPFYDAVEESIKLYILKENYARLALPFIEIPPTWVSLGFYYHDSGGVDDYSYKDRIDDYFNWSFYDSVMDEVYGIYELSKEVKDPAKIINAAHRALDPPVGEVRSIRRYVEGGVELRRRLTYCLIGIRQLYQVVMLR